MNTIITRYKKIVFMVVVASVINNIAADSEKCKPCQAAAANAIKLSIQAVTAAALVATGKLSSFESALDVDLFDAVDSAISNSSSAGGVAQESLQDALAAALAVVAQDVVEIVTIDAVDASVTAVQSDIAAQNVAAK